MDNEVAVLAGYCMTRLSRTTITRGKREIPFVMIWDKNADRLTWAQSMLNKHMPGKKPVSMTWQQSRSQGVIQFTGARAVQFLRLVHPYLDRTPARFLTEP